MRTTRTLFAGTGAIVATAAVTFLNPIAAQAADPAANGTVALTGNFSATSAPLLAPYSGKVTASGGSQGLAISGAGTSHMVEGTVADGCIPAFAPLGTVKTCDTLSETLVFDSAVTEPIVKLYSFGWGFQDGAGAQVKGYLEPRIQEINGKAAPAVSLIGAVTGVGAGFQANTLTMDASRLVGSNDNVGIGADVQLPGSVSSVKVDYVYKAVKTAGPANSTPMTPQKAGALLSLSREIQPVTAAVTAKDDDAKTVTIGGKGEPGSTVTVDAPGGAKTATVGSDGTWSLTVDGLAEGSNDVTVSQPVKDEKGATITSKVQLPVTIDAPAPATPLTAQVDSKDDAAKSAVFSGTGTPGATVEVTTPTGPETTTVGADGTWTLTATGLAEGQNDLTVTSGGETAAVTVIIAAQEVPVLLGLAGFGLLGATGAVIGRRTRAAKK
ncbi:hypothetical protein ABCS02_18265 [Microbacterium sp. X-17]|uniref:hypothetical protein n=1 Tax=Microbacterium sp. X-17 TaxID=3144404 RepID=UPI0031F5C9E6